MSDGWFLPVHEDDEKGNQIRENAKYHYFVNCKSLCKNYDMNTGFFETNIESGEIAMRPNIACKKCYQKWLKKFNILR